MINNSLPRWIAVFSVIFAAAGCSTVSAQGPEPYQGVVEYEERRFGFELPGRVSRVAVTEGTRLTPGAVIAELDSELERSTRRAQAAQAEAAKAEVDVIRAGARGEEIRSMEARVRAARALEELLTKNLNRDRVLVQNGVIAQSVVDDLEGELARATAERQALEHSALLLRRGGRKEDIAAAESRARAAASSMELVDLRIARHELKSVMDGTVLDVHVEPGEIVTAGAPVVTVADTARPYVDVFVPQGKIAGIRLETPAKVRVDALPEALSGRVEFVSPKTEFTPRFLFSERERPNLVVRVRVRIDDGKGRLVSGLPAFVEFSPAAGK